MKLDNNKSSFNQKLDIIDAINSLQLKNVSIEEIMELLRWLSGGHRTTAMIGGTIVFYRGIKYDLKPKLYQDLIYPPIEFTKVSRANIQGEQMFYASTKKKAVFYELGAQQAENFVIGTWISSPRLLLNNVGYTSENLRELGAKDLTPLFNNSGIKNDEQDLISNFLARTFSQQITDENYYKLTNAIARNSICQIGKGSDFFKEFEGLLYPTIKYKANADNVVLKKDAVDSQKITLERAEYIEIVNYVDGKYQYRIKDVCDTLNGDKLIWKCLKNTWSVNDETEDIYFIGDTAFNENGDQIEPDK